MDFMKVLDQTVREIKREVNLKVLKVPEIEQKVLDATSNEPWGPHGSALAEISQATKKFTECQMIMNVLWTRLTDTGPNWRHVYKALAVIEYLLANGSERAVDDILERSLRISSLSDFEYVEPNGKDVGINVRKKVETIMALLNDKEKMQAVRNKAAANRDKYFGLSSSGITYKSGSASYGGSSFQHNHAYGGLSGANKDETFKDGYKDSNQNGDEIDKNHGRKDVHDKSQERRAYMNENTNLTKGTTHLNRDSAQSKGTKSSAKHSPAHTPKSSNAEMKTHNDDFAEMKTHNDDFDPRGSSTSHFDDFDPRGSLTSEPVATGVKQMDLFGESLIGDLMDAPTLSAETVSKAGSQHEVDLFEDATFVSAIPHAETSTGSSMQGQVDLFAEQPTIPTSLPNVDLFFKPDSEVSTKKASLMSPSTTTFDPFASMPRSSSESSDLFGDFTSHTDSASLKPIQNSGNDNMGNLNHSTSLSSKPAPMKDNFQVKSGIWADSLSRGLIDLNLTAPKKVSLSDIGIVGGLTDGSDEKERRPPASIYMGRAMGTGSGLGKSGFPL